MDIFATLSAVGFIFFLLLTLKSIKEQTPSFLLHAALTSLFTGALSWVFLSIVAR